MSPSRVGMPETSDGAAQVQEKDRLARRPRRGGIRNNFGGTLNVLSSTITENTSPTLNGTGIYNETGGTVNARSSIVAGNEGTNIRGTINDGNLNIIGGDPRLGPLEDNGGPTETHVPLTGSPAIDKGDDSSRCPTTDQHGEARPVDVSNITNAPGGDGSDVGSVELQPVTAVSVADAPVTEGDAGTTNASFELSLSEAATSRVRVGYATSEGSATAPEDFVQTSGTLTFASGETTKTVPVPVNGDTTDEGEAEGFLVRLSNPVSASSEPVSIADGTGEGTVLDDDVDSGAPTVTETTPTGKGVSPKASVTATFSEAMDRESVKAPGVIKLVRKGTSTPVKETVGYDAEKRTVTLDPANSLVRGAIYRATISTDAKDAVGNALARPRT